MTWRTESDAHPHKHTHPHDGRGKSEFVPTVLQQRVDTIARKGCTVEILRGVMHPILWLQHTNGFKRLGIVACFASSTRRSEEEDANTYLDKAPLDASLA
jgi:hypothetical protein